MNALPENKTRDESCDTHGNFESHHLMGRVWSKCPKCVDELALKQAEEAERLAIEKAQERWVARVISAGIPPRFQDRSLDSFVADSAKKRAALNFAQTYADQFVKILETGRSAIFVGKPGTGKTHLACGIGMRIMGEGHKVLFASVLRAIRRIKETWGKDSRETETEAIQALVSPELLILDEIGIQFGSDTEKMMLFDVLNERYEYRRPTILISNLPLPEVKNYLGERLLRSIGKATEENHES